jgi:hypothetical protein
MPVAIEAKQSRNLACAVRSDWNEVVRCSSSRSSWVFNSWSCGTGSCVTSTGMCQIEMRHVQLQTYFGRSLAVLVSRPCRAVWLLALSIDVVFGTAAFGGAALSTWGMPTRADALHLSFLDIERCHSSQHLLMSRICRTLPRVPLVRCYSSTAQFTQAQCLELDDNDDIKGFDVNRPAILKKSFMLSAITKWFAPSTTDKRSCDINTSYLEQHGSSTVPLELTRSSPHELPTFERFEAPLSLLLAHMTGPPTPYLRIYLAQHSLADLPTALQADLPTPALLTKLGRGDIYASSLWMGRPPTRTPLHRDPNPNLFVQLAGQKVIRLLSPKIGRGVYERAKLRAGGGGRANLRGEEMMVGDEMQALEEAVWDAQDEGAEGVEAQLSAGDGLYIPLGWWHAVRGIGEGANASVCGCLCEGSKLT